MNNPYKLASTSREPLVFLVAPGIAEICHEWSEPHLFKFVRRGDGTLDLMLMKVEGKDA